MTEVAEDVFVKGEGGDGGRSAAKRRLLARTRAITPDDAQGMLAAREADWQDESGL